MRKATGNEDYRFGDLTKGAADEVKRSVESVLEPVATSITGKESYQFGDLTRKVLSDADEALATTRDAYFEELPAAMWRQLFGGLTPQQRSDVVIALCQFTAVCVLSLSLVSNLLQGAFFSVAWGLSSRHSRLSPIAAGQWPAPLRCETHTCIPNGVPRGGLAASPLYSLYPWPLRSRDALTAPLLTPSAASTRALGPPCCGRTPRCASHLARSCFLHGRAVKRRCSRLDSRLGPLLLPAELTAAALLTPRYRRAVAALQARMPLRASQPVLSRVCALAVAWALVNGVAVLAGTAAGVAIAAAVAGVPVWPPSGVVLA